MFHESSDHNLNDSPTTDSENDTCSYAILPLCKKRKSTYEPFISNDDIHAVKLANILHKANAPLYLYDSIMTWESESTMTAIINFLIHHSLENVFSTHLQYL